MLLYAGLPAELVSIGTLLLFAGNIRLPLSGPTLSVVIPIAITVAMVPLAIPFSFVLRVSVVAQRTAAITPFTTAEQERPGTVIESDDHRFGD